MPNKNVKVIIPLAVGTWLPSLIFLATGMPQAEVVVVLSMAVGIPTMVFYLLAEQGWSTLAKRYRSPTSFTGVWRTLRQRRSECSCQRP